MKEYKAKSGKIYTGFSENSLQKAIDAVSARAERAKASGSTYVCSDDEIYQLAQSIETAAAPAASSERPIPENPWQQLVRAAFHD